MSLPAGVLKEIIGQSFFDMLKRECNNLGIKHQFLAKNCRIFDFFNKILRNDKIFDLDISYYEFGWS